MRLAPVGVPRKYFMPGSAIVPDKIFYRNSFSPIPYRIDLEKIEAGSALFYYQLLIVDIQGNKRHFSGVCVQAKIFFFHGDQPFYYKGCRAVVLSAQYQY